MKINGGLIPIMETPNGTIITESSIITQFSLEYGEGGMKLMPNEGVKGDMDKSLAAALVKL